MTDHPGFEIVCKKCGSKNIHVKDSRGWSEETGAYGSIDLRCRDCGNEQDIEDLAKLLNENNDE